MDNASNNKNLTEIDFWDDYWSTIRLPSQVNTDLPFERCLSRALKKYLKPFRDNSKVLEIGCAPGKWLSFMSKTFNLEPHGIEYSKTGAEITLKNMKLVGLNNAYILSGDFFSILPRPEFDVVMSFGFIEHFSDVDFVINRHTQWLRPGGILILGIPNFSGINKIIQKILYKDILDKHNLNIMNLSYFEDISKKIKMKKKYIGYLGGFDPVLAIGSDSPPNKLQFCVNVFLQIAKKIRSFRIFDFINGAKYSSYVLSIYENKA